jgi:hypothetical protein
MPLTEREKAKIERNWAREFPGGYDLETEWEAFQDYLPDLWDKVKRNEITSLKAEDEGSDTADWMYNPDALNWLREQKRRFPPSEEGGKRRKTRKNKKRSKKTKRRSARK